MNITRKIEIATMLGVGLLILGLLLLIFPLHMIFGEPDKCQEMPLDGIVRLKDAHTNQSWESFDHENCGDIDLETGEVLWHLVLSPVESDATAVINGVVGNNHGGSIHWTFINDQTTALDWEAQVSGGLTYSGPECNLQTDLRVSHTCYKEDGGDGDGDGDTETGCIIVHKNTDNNISPGTEFIFSISPGGNTINLSIDEFILLKNLV